MTAIVPGFVVLLGLIVALGAQNVFVLRQGAAREHVLLVVVLCAASDAVLIAVGVAGVGAVVAQSPGLLLAARWGGAIFLLVYAGLSARRALAAPVDPADVDVPVEPSGPGQPGGTATLTRPRRRAAVVAATTLALTWLNPHVYLDTVVLIGSIAATHGDDRWWFAVGAMLGSVGWFVILGLGARLVGRWLDSPVAWRVIDAVVAVTMVAMAAGLVLSA